MLMQFFEIQAYFLKEFFEEPLLIMPIFFYSQNNYINYRKLEFQNKELPQID